MLRRSSCTAEVTTACSMVRGARWRDGVFDIFLERRCGAAGARVGADALGSLTHGTIGCRKNSWEGSGRCASTSARDWTWSRAQGLTLLAGIGDARWQTGGVPAKKFVSLGAYWRGLSGGDEGGGRGLHIGSNGAQFEELNRLESTREENGNQELFPCVIHVPGD